MYIQNFIIVLCCLMSCITSSCKIISLSHKKIILINTVETKNCFVSYVSINGVQYLVKQKKLPNKQISVVRDALAAYIARSLKIAHDVDIIKFNHQVPGKVFAEWPATFHTLARGDTVRRQRDSVYSKLRLRQAWASATNLEEMGLTRDIITQMTWHKQLPTIIALDILIGNSDRHCGNLCYDPETDTFCAIDMDDTFNKDFCEIACQKLLLMKKSGVQFSSQEIAALIKLRGILRYLLKKHTSDHLIKKMYKFAAKAGFAPGKDIYTPSNVKKLNHYSVMIQNSWANGHKLITILNTIIDQGITKKVTRR
jgi:hypothetical protein